MVLQSYTISEVATEANKQLLEHMRRARGANRLEYIYTTNEANKPTNESKKIYIKFHSYHKNCAKISCSIVFHIHIFLCDIALWAQLPFNDLKYDSIICRLGRQVNK